MNNPVSKVNMQINQKHSNCVTLVNCSRTVHFRGGMYVNFEEIEFKKEIEGLRALGLFVACLKL